MPLSIDQFNKTMTDAAGVINFSKSSIKGKDNKIHDENGFAKLSACMLQALENFHDLNSNQYYDLGEAISAGSMNFSKSQSTNFSMGDTAGSYDVKLVDIMISTQVRSHTLSTFCMQRPMESDTQNIQFTGLKAVNTAGGYTKGDIVIDPRTAIGSQVDLGRSGATGTTDEQITVDWTVAQDPFIIDIGKPVVKGSIVVTWGDTLPNVTANKLAYDDQFIPISNGVSQLHMYGGQYNGAVDSVSIDYNTGILTVTPNDSVSRINWYMRVAYNIDRIGESDGASTLKLKPFTDNSLLVSSEDRVIIQNNPEIIAKQNKMLRKNASYGIKVDFAKRAIDQVVALYTHYVDLKNIKSLLNMILNVGATATLDMSGYSTSTYTQIAATKNDRLCRFIRKLTSTLLTSTGLPATALICDEVATLLLANDSDNWIPMPAFAVNRNGIVGTYNGIPVVRDVFLNGKVPGEPTYGMVAAVHRSIDGNAAPVAFGEYLPPYSTMPAINANNPGEISQAMFSNTASKDIVSELISWGYINPYN